MNTLQLLEVLSKDLFLSKRFQYVLPLDKFMQTDFPFSSSIIFNYDTSEKPGSHWVAVFISEKGKIEYFDSYGIKPITKELLSKICSLSNVMPRFNLIRFQSKSFVCGQYCLIFLMLRARGFSFSFIQNLLLECSTPHERDHILNMFINKLTGFNLDVHKM